MDHTWSRLRAYLDGLRTYHDDGSWDYDVAVYEGDVDAFTDGLDRLLDHRPVRLCIAGSRKVNRRAPVRRAVSAARDQFQLPEPSPHAWRVLSGNSPAHGADLCGELIAKEMGVPVVRYDADTFSAAGPGRFHVRNRVMAYDCTHAVVVLYVPGDVERCYLASDMDNRGSRSLLGYLRLFERPTVAYGCNFSTGKLSRLNLERFEIARRP